MKGTQALTRFLALATTIGLAAGCGGVSGIPVTNLVESVTPGLSTTRAAERSILADDTDLGGPAQKSIFADRLQREAVGRAGRLLLFPTHAAGGRTVSVRASSPGDMGVSGVLRYFDAKGQELPAENVRVDAYIDQIGGTPVASTVMDATGSWHISLDRRYDGKHLIISMALANNYWNIQGESAGYAWQGGDIAKLQAGFFYAFPVTTLDKGSTNAQAAFIHEIYNRYLRLFNREGVDLNWWNRSIDTYWPAGGDYYSGSVNLTHADHWDVNGHEIGHAVTFMGTNTHAGGGQHYIDRCYSDSLAWSEGVATFFSGAVSLDAADPDAKFEFLVPRRAPIRIENVPDDVCKGQTNEWRVAATMWDIYDRHDDGQDHVGLSFRDVWDALANLRSISSITDVLPELVQWHPEQKMLLRSAFRQNTINI